jgi:signal peptidase I
VVATYFYSDNDLLYSERGPATLNKLYLESGDQVVTQVLQLSDGTILRRSETISIPNGAIEYFSPKIMRNLGAIYIVMSLLAFYALVLLGLYVTRRVYAKHKWKQNHIAGVKVASTLSNVDAEARYREYMHENSKKRDLKAVGLILLVPTTCLAVLYLVNTHFIGQFTVNGISMETTFRDRSKKTLLKLPVTYAKVTRSRYVPDRGTAVVFEKKFTSIDELSFVPEEEFVVKRVLGLPGERVVINGVGIRVYPKGSDEGIVPDDGASWESVIETNTRRNVDIVLKENEIFVAGDNRENSVDSRDYGPIEVSQVIGKVLYKSTPGLAPFVAPIEPPVNQ